MNPEGIEKAYQIACWFFGSALVVMGACLIVLGFLARRS